MWPARSRPLTGVLVFVFIALLSAGLHLLHSPPFGWVAFVVLACALLPYYVPHYYRLDQHGVHVASPLWRRSREWEHYRVFFRDAGRGVLLSPVSRLNLLARTRGLYLSCPQQHERLLAWVQSYLPEDAVPGSQHP